MHKALVTGASRGIGFTIAEVLQQKGIEVLTPSRKEMDLSNPASITAYLQSIQDAVVDILVNNAGINYPAPLEQLNAQNLQQTLQVNLEAPLQLIQGLAPGMKAKKWGRIVNISSIFSLVSREKRIAYTASKAGLNGLTQTAAIELAPFGVLVNALCPGYVATDLTYANNPPEILATIIETIPMKRLAEPIEIAKMVAFLCSEENTYLTGQTIAVDGGFLCQ